MTRSLGSTPNFVIVIQKKRGEILLFCHSMNCLSLTYHVNFRHPNFASVRKQCQILPSRLFGNPRSQTILSYELVVRNRGSLFFWEFLVKHFPHEFDPFFSFFCCFRHFNNPIYTDTHAYRCCYVYIFIKKRGVWGPNPTPRRYRLSP